MQVMVSNMTAEANTCMCMAARQGARRGRFENAAFRPGHAGPTRQTGSRCQLALTTSLLKHQMVRSSMRAK